MPVTSEEIRTRFHRRSAERGIYVPSAMFDALAAMADVQAEILSEELAKFRKEILDRGAAAPVPERNAIQELQEIASSVTPSQAPSERREAIATKPRNQGGQGNR